MSDVTEEYERRFEINRNDLYGALLKDDHTLESRGFQDIYYQNYIYHDKENMIEERIRKITSLGEFGSSNPICKKTLKIGKGKSRGEIKNVLNIVQFDRLRDYLEGFLGYKPIIKLHSEFKYSDNSKDYYTIEYSEFIKPEYQTSLIEIEFPTEAVMYEFEPPEWFGKEVTEEYSNVNIWEKYNLIDK